MLMVGDAGASELTAKMSLVRGGIVNKREPVLGRSNFFEFTLIDGIIHQNKHRPVTVCAAE